MSFPLFAFNAATLIACVFVAKGDAKFFACLAALEEVMLAYFVYVLGGCT